MLPSKGHVFQAKYRVEALIGAGGFARVYRARFEDVDRDVALKILVPQSTNPDEMYPEELFARFHREARAVSDLKSPHTITLHDFGATPTGLLYMIFEYVDGTPLDKLVKEGGPLRPERVVHILRQILSSLREAHAVGMLHRDVKPANVMVFDYLDQRDNVKVLDFGIAKQWTHTAEGEPLHDDLTEDGTVMGTPRYMSPEQIVGQNLTPATDIYSLGLVVYEMLVGAPAAPQTQKSEVVRRHLSPEPFELPPDVPIPGGLRGIVSRMLAKRREERFATADDVIRALNEWERHGAVPPQPARSLSPGNRWSGEHAAQRAAPPGSTPRYGESQGGDPRGAPPPNFGGGQVVPHPEASGEAQYIGAASKPERTFIQMSTTPTELEVAVPMKPNQRSFLVLGVGAVVFVVAFIATGLAWVLTLPLLAWGVGLVFQTNHLVINTETGYELTVSVFGYDRARRGPMASVVRFAAIGTDADDNTVLKIITYEGEFTVANAFSEAENRWVASEGNRWLEEVRAARPNPVA